jgi:hypothetical protein
MVFGSSDDESPMPSDFEEPSDDESPMPSDDESPMPSDDESPMPDGEWKGLGIAEGMMEYEDPYTSITIDGVNYFVSDDDELFDTDYDPVGEFDEEPVEGKNYTEDDVKWSSKTMKKHHQKMVRISYKNRPKTEEKEEVWDEVLERMRASIISQSDEYDKREAAREAQKKKMD